MSGTESTGIPPPANQGGGDGGAAETAPHREVYYDTVDADLYLQP